VIWAGGVTAQTLGKTLADRTKTETEKGGRIKVSPDLTVANYRDIYVVRDLALSSNAHGKPLPGVAQVAMQQGTYAAKAIMKRVQGKSEPKPFEYFDKGNRAVIGWGTAVAEIFGIHLSGIEDWLVWVFVHLMYVVQFQSRVLVFAQWAIQYLTFGRGSCLITDETATNFDFNKELPSNESTPIDNIP
jgi:NADH:ubiquinone reductase (H+-translocating)